MAGGGWWVRSGWWRCCPQAAPLASGARPRPSTRRHQHQAGACLPPATQATAVALASRACAHAARIISKLPAVLPARPQGHSPPQHAATPAASALAWRGSSGFRPAPEALRPPPQASPRQPDQQRARAYVARIIRLPLRSVCTFCPTALKPHCGWAAGGWRRAGRVGARVAGQGAGAGRARLPLPPPAAPAAAVAAWAGSRVRSIAIHCTASAHLGNECHGIGRVHDGPAAEEWGVSALIILGGAPGSIGLQTKAAPACTPRWGAGALQPLQALTASASHTRAWRAPGQPLPHQSGTCALNSRAPCLEKTRGQPKV